MTRFRMGGAVFLATILTGSFLLFLVQPMIARMALPRLGGAPAVWNSAMLVYQALLLGGYAYAHALGRFRPARQAMIHVALLAAAALWLPIGLAATNPPADASPVLWVPWLLALSIGPLFFAVAAQAPLMQRWYGIASGGRDPYALYAASNLGSFGGLIAYPLIVEPRMTLAQQSWLWSTGYAALGVLVVACALLLPRAGSPGEPVASAQPSVRPGRRRQLHWVLLSAVPSGLMLSTTTHMTTDIVAMPLLWVIPLGLYLLSFSVAFAERRGLADMVTRLGPFVILVFGGMAIANPYDPLVAAGLGLALLFVVATALHTQMYRLRPAADRLTGFYLAMSVGGVVGGLFAALIAPVVFDWTYEHPLLILAAALLVPQHALTARLGRLWGTGQRRRIMTLLVALLASVAVLSVTMFQGSGLIGALAMTTLYILAFIAIGNPVAFTATVAASLLIWGGLQSIQLSLHDELRSRSYFGVYTITESAGEKRQISHGTTVHGIQSLRQGDETEPTAYYARASGIGRAMTRVEPLFGPHARIGVVGLGAGTLACYARPGQAWRFYEIDPEVVRIARDSEQFSFLLRCTPDVPIDIGDARLTLAAAAPNSLDLVVLDAFSSDAIPAHLLTREALESYRRVLAPNGLIMVHISNHYLDLEPMLAVTAMPQWHARRLDYRPDAEAQRRYFSAVSHWVALSPDADTITRLSADDPDWRTLRSRPDIRPWTDDFSSILPLLVK